MRSISAASIPLFVTIRDNHPRVGYFAYYLEYLALHMPDHLLVPALEWLIASRLTGERFLQFVQGECHKSGLELIRYLTMRLEREKQLRALTVRDIRR